jgi:hypothetical protein
MTEKIMIDWDSVPLGEEPDHVIAKQYGCRVALVGDHRRKRGIPAPKKEAQTFEFGARATPEQIEQHQARWGIFPLEESKPCRQCEEDHYLIRRRSLPKWDDTIRRNTDCGVFCLPHYAAQPVCSSCQKGFAYRAGGICESCSRGFSRLLTALKQDQEGDEE